MKNTDYYKSKIVEVVCSVDDVVFLRRLYKLIMIVMKIDNDWILRQFDMFLDNIEK